MRCALNQETQPGTLIPPPELESQLMLKPHHIQTMLSTEEVFDQNQEPPVRLWYLILTHTTQIVDKI